ncbi:MAG: hypothetical protein KAG10_07760, partial [Methylococcales bacterium]|nr:hypothetical protein [Methylococcales bacterium]
MVKILVLPIVLFLVGCTSAQKLELVQNTPKTQKKQSLNKITKKISQKKPEVKEKSLFVKKILLNPQECSIPILTAEEKTVWRSVALLEAYLKQWRFVKYRLGGTSRRG